MKIICLTPVKNEAWILRRFLECASLWADYIIVADQGSTDGSVEIAKSYEKVILVKNNNPEFNEEERQKLLIDESRKIDGKKLLISLDADEFLTANFTCSVEWETLKAAKPGTVIKFKLINLLPNMEKAWIPDVYFPWGIIDDGVAEHRGTYIHSTRIPLPKAYPTILLNEIKVLHYQYTDWQRMESKHRWYECLEVLKNNKKHYIDIYRQYHHMYKAKYRDTVDVNVNWFSYYQSRGIDMTSVSVDAFYYWDKTVIGFLYQHSPKVFRKIDIWRVDWNQKAKQLGLDFSLEKDPRTFKDKVMYQYLRVTMPYYNKFIKLVDLILKALRL